MSPTAWIFKTGFWTGRRESRYLSNALIHPGFRSWDRQRREAQPFRSEVDGFLPLSRHRSAVLRGQVKPHSNDVRERKMTLKFHSRTPSLLQDCTSLPAFSV